MIKILIAILVAVPTSLCFANPLRRYVGTSYTCAELQELLQRDGELNVVHRIGYGTSYVSPERCAEFPYRAQPYKAYEPAADTNRCFVGYGCWLRGGH